MRYEFHILMALIAIGLFTKKLGWRSWMAVMIFVFSWLIFNWKKG